MSFVSSLSVSPADLLSASLSAAGLSSEQTSGAPLLREAQLRIVDEHVRGQRTFGFSPDEARSYAAERAEHYADLARRRGPEAALAAASRERSIPGSSVASQVARIVDPSFWARYYNSQAKRSHEFQYIKAGFVSGSREHYVSDSTLQSHRRYKESQKQFLQTYRVVDRSLNAKGKHTVRVLSDVTRSDEARKAELWAFLSGIEQLSVEAGLDCALLTLTLPAAFHANPGSGGRGYDGVSTPQDGGRVLASIWNKVQRDLDNLGIAVSGARFVEPHKDGTPHWHLWIHYAPEHLAQILAVLTRYFPGDAARRVDAVRVREVQPDLAGKLFNKKDGSRFTEIFKRFDADTLTFTEVDARFKAQVDLSVINRAYANGATYASKYAMKTLEEGGISERVAAARWVWRLRGFQLFGIRSCITAWRELFRCSEMPSDPQAQALWDAVHSKPGIHKGERTNPLTGVTESYEWEGGTAAFIRQLGGLAAASRSVPAGRLVVKLICSQAQGRYGDATRVKTGLLISNEDGEYLYSSTTRQPGRFVLMSERNLEENLKSLQVYFLPSIA